MWRKISACVDLAEGRVKRVHTRKRGPPSRPAEISDQSSGNSKHFVFFQHLPKFHNPRTTPSWRKVTQEEEREKVRVKMPLIDHYVPPATTKGR